MPRIVQTRVYVYTSYVYKLCCLCLGYVLPELPKVSMGSLDRSVTGIDLADVIESLQSYLLNSSLEQIKRCVHFLRTCSVVVPGRSRNKNSEDRKSTGDRSSDEPCPEVRYSSHHSGPPNSPEAEDYPHSSPVLTIA